MPGESEPERIRRDRPITADSPSALAVFTQVLSRGSTTRAELGALTGLSAGAVTKAVRPLLADGLVRERSTSAGQVGAGRPVQIVEVVAERERFVGIKVNADSIVAVATDLRASVTDTVEIALPRRGRSLAPHPRVDEVTAAIRAALADFGSTPPSALGIAVSGDVDRIGGVVEFSPLLGWESVPLADIVERATGLPVVLDNDVRAVTCAEQWFGDGLGIDDFAVVTIGAGIGCGLVVGSRIQRGSFGVAGELGHVCVDVDGPRCHCGARGCIEAIAGREELLTRAGALAGRRVRTMAGLSRLAASPDGAAVRELLEHTGRCVAVAIASVVNLFGPRRVLISAEGFDVDALFGPGLRQTLHAQCFGRAGELEVLTRELPFAEWARGAAVIAITDFVGHLV